MIQVSPKLRLPEAFVMLPNRDSVRNTVIDCTMLMVVGEIVTMRQLLAGKALAKGVPSISNKGIHTGGKRGQNDD